MVLGTVIKRLEEEQAKLDKYNAQKVYNRYGTISTHVQMRLTSALLLLYRLRDGVPLTQELDLDAGKSISESSQDSRKSKEGKNPAGSA